MWRLDVLLFYACVGLQPLLQWWFGIDRSWRVLANTTDCYKPPCVADDRNFWWRVRRYFTFVDSVEITSVTIVSSGGGTVDFQEFVGGLSAFSSRGGREEKLRCMTLSWSQLPTSSSRHFCSCVQGIRCRSRWIHIKRRTIPGFKNDGWQQLEGTLLDDSETGVIN